MSAVQIPPYTSSYYGYDGPWQAVTVLVGGSVSGSSDVGSLDNFWSQVPLLPGSYGSSWLVTPNYCHLTKLRGTCGIGGTWEPEKQQAQSSTSTDDVVSLQEPGFSASGRVIIDNMRIDSPDGATHVAPNVSLVTFEQGNRTWANGVSTYFELGLLALGGAQEKQVWSDKQGWLYSAYLYNSGVTTSFSYSLQLGSVAHNYPISLWFGGYDKNRAIGPGMSWPTESSPMLLDIVIGVETGGSPFAFSSMSGLLLGDTGTPAQMPVTLNALAPGLHLPQQTCDKLAQVLPVQYNTSNGYYMWNTTAPSYNKIINSPAYLGFIFPLNTSNSGSNMTIKVPFSLLNLTLDPLVSGYDAPAPYLPCMPSSSPSILGRAFLQAAFWASNDGNNISWLAQAPGPGPSRFGIGNPLPTNILHNDTSLDLLEGASLFQDSWSGYWTPIQIDNQTSGSSGGGGGGGGGGGSSNAVSSEGAGGIGAAVGFCVILLLVTAALFFHSGRHKQREHHRPWPLPRSGQAHLPFTFLKRFSMASSGSDSPV